LRVLDATGAQTIGDTKPVLDAANAAAAQKTLPPPPPEAVNPPTAKPDAPVTNHAAKQSVVAANKPSAQPIKEAERIPTPAPAAVQKTDAPKPQQQTVTPPQTVVQQRPAVPLPQAPVTGSTAINGWDANLPETKPAAPQQPQNEPPPDAKTVAFVGPKVLLQVTPSTRNLSANLISAVTRVEVEVRIDLTGHVSAVHLESPNVKPQLASAALAAARQWTFQPATLRGQRVESTHTIVFEFSPNGQ
jgi:TonB family protein